VSASENLPLLEQEIFYFYYIIKVEVIILLISSTVIKLTVHGWKSHLWFLFSSTCIWAIHLFRERLHQGTEHKHIWKNKKLMSGLTKVLPQKMILLKILSEKVPSTH